MVGTLLYRKGDFQAAIGEMTNTIQAVPDRCAAAYFNRATVFFRLGERDKAIDDLQSCLASAPPDWPLREKVRQTLVRFKGSPGD